MAAYGPSGFAPNRMAENFSAGRQAADQERASDTANKLGQQRLQLNEQESQQRQQALSEEQKRTFATKMVQAAQYGIQSQQPKAFIEQNFPELAQLAGPKWATADDNTVRASLQDAIGKFGPVAGVGPPQQKPDEFTLSPGQKRFVNGREVASVAPAEKPGIAFRAMRPDEIKAYGLPSGTAAQINEITGQINVLPGTSGGNITEGERGAANYYGRMKESEKLLTDFVPTIPQYMAAKKSLSGGSITSSIANNFLTPEQQSYYQAASDWVRAKLRKESGAAIGVDEMEKEIKTYFPSPGDSAAVVAQKKKAREQATTGMRRMGGRASAEYDQEIAAPQPSAGVARLSPEQAAQLPPRTQFVGMDGITRVKR
jgi:hypothetical protein